MKVYNWRTSPLLARIRRRLNADPMTFVNDRHSDGLGYLAISKLIEDLTGVRISQGYLNQLHNQWLADADALPQVGYSDDGGDTWSLVVCHRTSIVWHQVCKHGSYSDEFGNIYRRAAGWRAIADSELGVFG